MKTLNVYVDESGTYKSNELGQQVVNGRFYLISLVFHEANEDMSPYINKLNNHLNKCGITENNKVHCMPLVNREKGYYKSFTTEEVKKIFQSMNIYIKNAPIKHITILMDSNRDETTLSEYFFKAFTKAINENIDFFETYEAIVVYYDNGQQEVKKIIKQVFESFDLPVLFPSVSVQKNIKFTNYRLAEIADFLCSSILIGYRLKNGCSTSSEKSTFRLTYRSYKKQYLDGVFKSSLIDYKEFK